MPYKKKKKYYRKKSKKTAFRRSGTTTSGTPKTFPLGKKFLFKTRYAQLANTLNPGLGGVPVTSVYRLNSLFDPYQTGVGHQPLGFDQMMTMYDHYNVIGARATVTFNNADSTNAQTCLISVKDTNTVGTAVDAIIENGRCAYTTLTPTDGGRSTAKLVMPFSAKKFFGHSVAAEKAYQGDVASNPAEQAYLHVTVFPSDLATDSAAVYYDIVIEYVALLTEPRLLASS